MKPNEIRNLLVYADGGCHNNGGDAPKAYGSFVVKAVCHDGMEVEVKREQDEYPFITTNNQAEYESLIRALTYIKDLMDKGFAFHTTVLMDSALVINQVKGAWKVKDPILKEMNALAKLLVQQTNVGLRQVGRDNIEPVVGH